MSEAARRQAGGQLSTEHCALVLAEGLEWSEVVAVFVGDGCGLNAVQLKERLQHGDKQERKRLSPFILSVLSMTHFRVKNMKTG